MNIILFDPVDVRDNLLPMTYTRPVSELRLGIDTMRERWQAMLPGDYSWQTTDYLSVKYPQTIADDNLYIAGNVVATPELADAITALGDGQYIEHEGFTVAYRNNTSEAVEFDGEVTAIKRLADIFLLNDKVLRADYLRFATNNRREPSSSVTVIGDLTNLYIHPDAGDVEGCIINVKTGPVYIGPGATVMEGACMRGPIAVCEASTVNMGAKIYGATTIGPHCKVGGELNNVVMLSYSNKAHDGFLGNAVIGEWCNLGAGCVASNLKNDYTEIKQWNYPAHRFIRIGMQFCGLVMGDHSKVGINAMLNTATVLGVGVNIHGSGFPRPFLASFSEGSTAGFSDVPMSKFFDIARRMMARRDVQLTDVDIDIFNHIRQLAEQYR